MSHTLTRKDRALRNQHTRCGPTKKVMFKSHEQAVERIGEIFEEGTPEKSLRAYRCSFCGGWHITKS